jgi:hypothetical protein
LIGERLSHGKARSTEEEEIRIVDVGEKMSKIEPKAASKAA